MKKQIILSAILLSSVVVIAQNKDKAVFEEVKPGYYQNSILKGIDDYEVPEVPEGKVKRMKVDLSSWDIPSKPSEYKTVWYNSPISQGNTGTCWCFSTTSFYESEVKRASGKNVKLSEMYIVYWEYVERAAYFVESRGNMTLGEGSETNAVAKNMKKYGMVPYDHFTGMKAGQLFHNHEPMFDEIKDYLASVKEKNAWNKNAVVATVRSILDYYVGPVPTEVKIDGKKMSPQEYLKNELKINPNDYVDFMSMMDEQYYQKAEYKVPDNWWHSKTYNNVPLNDFMSAVKIAIDNGYSLSIGGDVSEPGFDKIAQAGVIPTWDVPSEFIDEAARLQRFQNGATTDDHAMHLIGYKIQNDKTWYLVKDSSSGSRNCGESSEKFGYYFIHEDYVKLKFMSFTVHKDAVKDILKKMKT
ncbi:MAG: C1 family peptidase [Flavobacteriales bacterium]|nr:C1 family peptidase [Flavobacteriales bacterium]